MGFRESNGNIIAGAFLAVSILTACASGAAETRTWEDQLSDTSGFESVRRFGSVAVGPEQLMFCPDLATDEGESFDQYVLASYRPDMDKVTVERLVKPGMLQLLSGGTEDIETAAQTIKEACEE